MPRVLIAIWLPTTFTTICCILGLYHWFFFLPAIVGAADIRSRYLDFRHLVKLRRLAFTEYTYMGLVGKTFRRYRSSACQRYAAVAAIPEMYYVFRGNGYEWWHVLPDGTFSRKSPYLDYKFYKSLFFGTR